MSGRCRIHGAGCSAPWGWDRDHTDSERPYTVDELAVRVDGPHFFAYPDADEYEAGWRLWRALRQDGRLNAAEDAVRSRLVLERLMDAAQGLS